MSLYAVVLVLYGSGFVCDCDTISVSNRLLAICAFRRSRKGEQVRTIVGLVMVASLLMVLARS